MAFARDGQQLPLHWQCSALHNRNRFHHMPLKCSFEKAGTPSEDRCIVFDGDLVDRGAWCAVGGPVKMSWSWWAV